MLSTSKRFIFVLAPKLPLPTYMYPMGCPYVIHGNHRLSLLLRERFAAGRLIQYFRRIFPHISDETRFCPDTHRVQVDVDLKVDLARPNALMFKACSKCNARVLKKVLDLHERFCIGAVERWGFRRCPCCFLSRIFEPSSAGGENVVGQIVRDRNLK